MLRRTPIERHNETTQGTKPKQRGIAEEFKRVESNRTRRLESALASRASSGGLGSVGIPLSLAVGATPITGATPQPPAEPPEGWRH